MALVARMALIRQWLLWGSCCLWFASACPLSAQRLFFDHIRVPGAVAMQVMDIELGPGGSLWLASDQGLFRYDGHRFVAYACPSGEGIRREDLTIDCLYLDPQQQLWIGTHEGELLTYDLAGDSLRLVYDFSIQGKLQVPAVNDMVQDEKGQLWVSFSSGLARIEAGQAVVFPAGNLPAARYPMGAEILSLAVAWGKLWLGYNTGAVSWVDLETESFSHLSLVPDFRIEQMVMKDDSLWMAVFGQGLLVMGAGDTTLHRRPLPEPIRDLSGLHPRGDGGWWLASINGLIEWDPATGHYQRYTHQVTDPRRSLPATPVNGILEDPQHRLWVGSGREGLVVSQLDAPHEFLPIFSYAMSAEWHAATHFLQDTAGYLWAGFFSGGLARFFPGGDMDWYRETEEGQGTIFDLLQDQRGRIWVARYGRGLQQWDPATQALVDLSDPSRPLGRTLPANDVRGLAEAADGRIWIATHGKGLFYYDPDQARFFALPLHDSPSNNWLNAVFVDQEQGIWVGSVTGVSYRPPGAESFRLLSLDEQSFVNSNVLGFFQRKQGDVYVFSNRGLTRFGPHQQAQPLAGEGLPPGVVEQVFEDRQGHLWLATRQALSYQDGGQFRQVLTLPPGDQFNPTASLITADGSVYLGLKSGIMHLDPLAAKWIDTLPPVLFTQLRVNQQEVRPGDGSGVLAQSLALAEVIYLDPDDRAFTLEFGTLAPILGRPLQFSYQLEGFEPGWNLVQDNQSVTYTALPPGRYQLKVRLQAGDGTERIRQIGVVVRPPFWRTGWAFTAYVLALGLLLFVLGYFQHMRSRLKIEAAARQQEQQYYTLRNQLFTYISHELRTPLTLIMGSLEPLRKAGGSLGAAAQERLNVLQRHSLRLYRLVNQLMDFRRLEEGVLELRPVYLELGEFLQRAVAEFEGIAAERNLGFSMHLPPEPLGVEADPEKLEQVFFNLLSNATKYTPAGGEIRVALSQKEQGGQRVACLSFWNDGPGMDSESLAQVFRPFFRGHTEPRQTGTGIGLAFTRALIDLHGGQIRLRSGKGAGVSVEVCLPLALAEPEAPLPVAPAGKEEQPLLLVADDHADIRALIRRELGAAFQVMEARNGKEALALAAAHHPDIILLDVRMPGGPDGIEVCRTLKSQPETAHLPVVLLSAQDSVDRKLDGLETGADEFLSKPFSPAVLQAQLESLLRNRERVRSQLMNELLLRPPGQPLPDGEDPFLKEVVAIVEAGLADPEFGPESLVEAMPFGKSHLYRRIKSLTGQSPGVFIRTLRLKEAASQLIADPFANVSQVAYAVGFKDPAYFSRCFKELFGRSPSAYHKARSGS